MFNTLHAPFGPLQRETLSGGPGVAVIVHEGPATTPDHESSEVARDSASRVAIRAVYEYRREGSLAR